MRIPPKAPPAAGVEAVECELGVDAGAVGIGDPGGNCVAIKGIRSVEPSAAIVTAAICPDARGVYPTRE
jgi:hypothetical protein